MDKRKRGRQWFMVTTDDSYVSYSLVSARSLVHVEQWIVHQGKHGKVTVATAGQLVGVLKGEPVGMSNTMCSAPNNWLMQICNLYVVMAIID
jgi:hypothetical protein